MTDGDGPSQIKDLEARLKAARQHRSGATDGKRKRIPTGDLGPAVRVAVDLVSGIFVGVVIGWFLDRWLGTTPWLLLLFFVMGAAAGILNVMRTARQLEAEAARRRVEANRAGDKD